MNSEEIKEIGQLFLNISKQTQTGLDLSDDDVIKNIIKQVEDKCIDFYTKSDKETARRLSWLPIAEKRIEAVEETIKSLSNNTLVAGFDHMKIRLESAIEASRKFREDMRDKLHKLESTLLPTPEDYLKNKVGELGAKVGKFGNQVGGYGGLISTLQKENGERTVELNKIRKDYRELQEEMWERFKLTEAWIETKDSTEKDRIRLEILENGHTDKSEQQKIKLSSSLDTVKNTPDSTCVEPKKNPDSEIRRLANKVLHRKAEETKGELTKKDWLNWETSTSFAWSKIPISKLNNVSVRAHNALIEGGYQYIGNLLTESPYDLIKVKNFGRKCLREVMNALEEKHLVLNMQKFKEQREERNSKENTQRGNLYGLNV